MWKVERETWNVLRGVWSAIQALSKISSLESVTTQAPVLKHQGSVVERLDNAIYLLDVNHYNVDKR